MTTTPDGADLEALLALAVTAADLVVPRLREVQRARTTNAGTKSSPTDMVTEFDRWSEATIVAAITAARPDDGFIGEEGASSPGTSGVVWLIDPIDGTTNFVYDIPGSAVSIAARVDGTEAIGLVHDLVRDERFTAMAGCGATVDGVAISASGHAELATALVATGFSYDADRRRGQAETLVDLLPRIRDIRRSGGAAVDLCSVACGRADAYYEVGLNPWDWAAGSLIAREAGAIVSMPTDDAAPIAASAPALADDFFAALEHAR